MMYYKLGQISYTRRYSIVKMVEMVDQSNTYGPWDSRSLSTEGR